MKRIHQLIAGILCLSLISMSVSAQYCTTRQGDIQEKQAAKFDTTKGGKRGLADNFYLWNVGQSIKVRFMNGTEEQQSKVMALAKEWEQYANIKFEQVKSEPVNIRVEFSDEEENYSLIGMNSNQADPAEHTMHFWSGLFGTFGDATRLRRTVIHEFGHSLGFLHEHSSPISGIQWNKDTMYKEYAKFGWDKDDVDFQVFEVYDKRYTNGTSYDPKSIMHYPIPAHHTLNGYSVNWNTDFSEGDKQLAGMLYPFSGVRANEVPRVNILNFTTAKVTVDKAAGGLNIYPSFNLTTEGATGDVFLCVLLFNKDGYAIPAKEEKYNINGVVGSYKALRMGPGKRYAVNKENPEEFPLFVPLDHIPNTPANSEIQILFRTYVNDGQTMRSIYNSSPVKYQMGSR